MKDMSCASTGVVVLCRYSGASDVPQRRRNHCGALFLPTGANNFCNNNNPDVDVPSPTAGHAACAGRQSPRCSGGAKSSAIAGYGVGDVSAVSAGVKGMPNCFVMPAVWHIHSRWAMRSAASVGVMGCEAQSTPPQTAHSGRRMAESSHSSHGYCRVF